MSSNGHFHELALGLTAQSFFIPGEQMKKQTLDAYVKHANDGLLNKTITTPDGAETQVSNIRIAVQENSELLERLPRVGNTGRTTEIPIIEYPDDDDTDFTIGAISLTKSLQTSTANLTDETLEDATPDLFGILDRILATQVIQKAEQYVAGQIQTLATEENGPKPKSLQSVISLIKAFPDEVKSTVGQWVIFTSVNTHFDIISQLTPAELALIERLNLIGVALYGFDDNTLAVGHTHGLAMDYEIREVERDRQAGRGRDVLLAHLNISFGADNTFLKKVELVNE